MSQIVCQTIRPDPIPTHIVIKNHHEKAWKIKKKYHAIDTPKNTKKLQISMQETLQNLQENFPKIVAFRSVYCVFKVEAFRSVFCI